PPVLRVFPGVPPPASPLFPYTTLFRSRREDDAAEPIGITARQSIDERAHHPRCRGRPMTAERRVHPAFRKEDVARPKRWMDATLDRKSTRLNSSHGSISYAVFCLKKKN